MPIRLIIRNDHAFSPEDAKILIDAFEAALKALNVDREDPLTMLLAKRIVELAKEGEHDPIRLRLLALATL